MRFDSLTDAVQSALQQELDLLAVLSADQYSAASRGPFTSSVGMHIRHNLDHFEALFLGLPKGQVDYESRGRNTMIEELPEVAIAALQKYMEQLDILRSQETDEVILVREESEVSTEARRWLTSSIGRELQFLLGHTVHHNALIAMIVHSHGLDLPGSFGVAPSTQRYEQGRPASS